MLSEGLPKNREASAKCGGQVFFGLNFPCLRAGYFGRQVCLLSFFQEKESKNRRRTLGRSNEL